MISPTNADAIESALARPSYLPAGTTAAFLEQSRDQPTVIAILFVACLVVLVVAVRCYARRFIVRDVGLDDGLALLSLVSSLTGLFLPVLTGTKRSLTLHSSFYALSSSIWARGGISYTFNTSSTTTSKM